MLVAAKGSIRTPQLEFAIPSLVAFRAKLAADGYRMQSPSTLAGDLPQLNAIEPGDNETLMVALTNWGLPSMYT